MAGIADKLDKAYEDKPLTELVYAPVEALRGVGPADAERLKAAFYIKTIGYAHTMKTQDRSRPVSPSQADIDACGVPAPSTVDSDAVDAHAPHVRGGPPSAAVPDRSAFSPVPSHL